MAQTQPHFEEVLPAAYPFRKYGFAVMALAITLLAMMDLIVKLASARFSTVQLAWGRYTMQAVTMFAMTGMLGVLSCTRSKILGAHLARALLLLVGNISFMLALRYLPLTEANVIGFASPLFITALSYPLLRERVSAGRWFAVAVGFAGVLVVMRPGSALFQWAAVLPLAMAATGALYHVTTPLIRRHEDPSISVFVLSVMGAVGFSFIAPFSWTQPDALGWLGLSSIRVLGALGHVLIIKAFSLAPAASLAPFFYVYLLWAIIFGFVFFDDVPTWTTMFGSILVIASGIHVYRA